MITPHFAGHVPPILFTKSAVASFASLFHLTPRESKWTLIRLGESTRILMRAKTARGIVAVQPAGADVVMLARKLPGLEPMVVTSVTIADSQDEGDDMGECRRAA